MTYHENLSLVDYVNYRNAEILDELARRDKLNQMTCDERIGQRFAEPDNQMVFDFYKEVVSVKEVANNESVKDPWVEAYETGRRIGFKQGLKEAPCDGIREEGECRCDDLNATFGGVR